MKILQTVTKVPGGLMVVPMFIGVLVNTFAPEALKIGGFTEALTNKGYLTLVAMYLFVVGTKMTLRAAPVMLKRGFGIMFAKVGTAIILSMAVAYFFDGNFLGLTTLAILAAMNDTNGGMFMALTSTFGDKEDAGTYVPQSIETGPFLTMLILVGAGLANIPWLTMVSVIAPIAAGAILANLDEELREFFGSREAIIVPFMAFALGQTINLNAVLKAGLQGVLLGLTVLVATGAACIVIDRLLGGSGVAGAAVAIADPSYALIAPVATIQVAASVIITALLTPLLTAIVFKRNQSKAIDVEPLSELPQKLE